IILRAFEDELCEHIIVMVQKEVAEKFTAKTNDKEYSSLGIITELISINSKILFDVPAEAFDPPPKVTSSILYIKKDMSKSLDKDFNKFLKACFIQPRKKLSKNLTTIFDKNIIFEIYKELNINDNVRPHEVSSSLYSQMYTKVKNGRNK
ncbi:rRNA adenine N-6-methyltransferase family protein, partial [Aliarcobacter butzleri]